MHELIKKEIKENQDKINKRINSHAYTPAMSLFIIERNIHSNEEKILKEDTIRESWYHYLSEKDGDIEDNHIYNGLLFVGENLVENDGFKLSYHLVDFKNNTSEVFFSFNSKLIHNKIIQIIESHYDSFLSQYKTLNAMLNSVRRFYKDSTLIKDDVITNEYRDVLLALNQDKENSEIYSCRLNKNQALLIKHIEKLHSMLGYGQLRLSIDDRYNEKYGGEEIKITDNIKLKICEIMSLKRGYSTRFKITFTGTKRFNDIYSEMKEKLEEKREKEHQEMREREKREEEREREREKPYNGYSGRFGISN